MAKVWTVLFDGVAVLAPAFVWIALVPLLVRPFGIRLPLWPFQRKQGDNALLALPLWQCMLIQGVLFYGCGMLIGQTLFDWILDKAPFRPPSAKAWFTSLVFCLLGIAFSYSEWHRSRRLAAKQSGKIRPLPPANR